MADPDEKSEVNDLDSRVRNRLKEQGYPTEFRTADICRRHGFRVWQGLHVRDEQSSAPREIDVVATADLRYDNWLVRVEHVFECKWSKDKPWIVFTGASGQIAPSACVTQSIGNLLGSAVVWALAGDAKLHSLDHFMTPERPGFGGRQAFSKGFDYFYSAVAAASELAHLHAKEGEQIQPQIYEMPRMARLSFPVVVVEGSLYEAYFDSESDDIKLESRKRIRCHWRGSSSRSFITTLDVVSLDHLDEFMALRATETEPLLTEINKAVINISECFKVQSLKPLKVTSGARGVIGLPRLFVDLRMLDEVKAPRSKRARNASRKES